jgi:hemolysin D
MINRQNHPPKVDFSEVITAEHLPEDLPSEDLQQPESFVSVTKTDWSDAAKELIESLPQVWTRGMLYFLVFFAMVVIPWACIAKVDETGTGRGRLETKGSPHRLEAAVAGTVNTVRVKEGDIVEKDQILLELESDQIKSDLQQAQTKLEGQKNRQAQLLSTRGQILPAIEIQKQQNSAQLSEKLAQAEQTEQSLVDKQSASTLMKANTTAQIRQAEKFLSNSKSALLIQQSEKAAQVNQTKQKLSATKTAYVLTNSRYTKDLREVKRYQTLFQQGVIPETKLLEVESLAAESKKLNAQALSEIKLAQSALAEQQLNYTKVTKQLAADIQQNEFQVQEKQREYQKLTDQQNSDLKQADIKLKEEREGQKGLRSTGKLSIAKTKEQLNEVQSQIITSQTEIAQSEAQIQELNRQLEARLIKSPTSGTILQFPYKQAKTFVQTGQLVAQIAPKNSSMVLKAQMPSQESGFLKAGMPVKIKFDAYPFQDYDVVDGKVQWVSPDSKIIESGVTKQEVFELDVVLDQSYIQYQNKRISLSLGQAASAEVIVRQRRIIDFVLDPFRQLSKSGMKL